MSCVTDPLLITRDLNWGILKLLIYSVTVPKRKKEKPRAAVVSEITENRRAAFASVSR